MFEKLVESLLEEYVSEWVEGLDAEKMKIALFGGKVEFRELKLKASSLDKFQLPLKIKEGTLGRLSLRVPWKRLTKEAVKIQVDDLFLLVVPSHQEALQNQETDSYALRVQWAKQQEVRVRELFEKNKQEEARSAGSDESAGGGDTTASWGYREKMMHNIIDNVAFEITNIHVRYEDITHMVSKNPLALGVTIQSITASTTNANGMVTFVDRSQSHTPFVHRQLDIVKAGFYCDDTSTVQELGENRRQEPNKSSYIIHPFNTSIKMTSNYDETTASSIPRLQFIGDISSIDATVTPDQCNDLISVINYISTHEMYLKHLHCRRKRPTVTVRGHARVWWQYAMYGVQVMYSLNTKKLPMSASKDKGRHRRCTWKLFGQLWLRRKQYIGLMKKIIKADVKKTPNDGMVMEHSKLNELERVLDVETIVFFRLCAVQEAELEDSRHVKKLSHWKARWSKHGPEGDHHTLKKLDPLEKLALYSTISDQMHASSVAFAAKELEKQNSKAILFALDFAVNSFSFSLVDHFGGMVSSASTKEFLRFELQKFMFAIFQRSGSSTISASIKSIHMLDFSNALVTTAGEIQPQALFYALTGDCIVQPSTSRGSSDAVDVKQKNFVDLHIDSSEQKFKLDCSFQPFRFIYNLSVFSKLQGYFTAQVDVSPAVKENAEEALVASSLWLNNAVFATTNASSPVKPSKQRGSAIIGPTCVVDLSVQLPQVDVFVLTGEVSPILQAKLSNIHFRSGNLADTFAFAIDSVEIIFADGLHQQDGTENAGVVPEPVASPLPRSESGRILPRTCVHGLHKRKHSTILRKTRLVFQGEKIVERNRAPRWLLKCTAPPIYFTLSTAQYQQVLHSSASWATSNQKPAVQRPRAEAAASSTALLASNAVKASESAEAKAQASAQSQSAKVPTSAQTFDPADERFALCVHIPRILVVLQGEGGMNGSSPPSSDRATQPAPNDDDELAIDLVLDIKRVNAEVKATSVAQAVALDFRSLMFFKRRHSDEKRTKESLIEEDSETSNDGTDEQSDASNGPFEPDPAYDPVSGLSSCKLLEIPEKVTFLISSFEPFKGTLRARTVVIYWDHGLLTALFRSYLLSTFLGGSNSTPSSRSGSGSDKHHVPDHSPHPATAALSYEPRPPAPFGLELLVDRWFIFLRPLATVSPKFSFRLHGKNLRIDVSTLKTAYVVTQVHAKDGATLESFRIVGPSEEGAGGEEACELLRVHQSLKLIIETAGYGCLRHRTSAGGYVNVQASKIDVNYVNAHYMVLIEHLQKQIIGFFNWVTVQMKPTQVVHLNQRTKVDADLTAINVIIPRGAVGNPTERQKKPEKLEIEVRRVSITSRVYPENIHYEQVYVVIEHVRVSTCLYPDSRHHTGAISSVDEAVDAAKEHEEKVVQAHEIAASRTRILEEELVYVDVVSIPLPVETKKGKSKDLVRMSTNKKAIDFEDVAREMENMCSIVRVALSPLQDDDERLDDDAKIRAKALEIDVGKVVDLALDQHQLELMACLLNENFSKSELPPRKPNLSPDADEKKQADIQVHIGDVCLKLLQADKYGELTDPTLRQRAKIELESVQVSIFEFASGRAQHRVSASKAALCSVDVNIEADGDIQEAETPCAEVDCSSESQSTFAIDITIDQYPSATRQPLDVRVHLESCAISPAIIPFAMRVAPFVLCTPRFPGYTPSPSQPVGVSVTTGMVHCLLAIHTPTVLGLDGAVDAKNDDDPVSLHLIASGCVVVRYSNGDDNLKHVQVFGRKMSLEITSRWPPHSEIGVTTSGSPSSPSSSPMQSPRRASFHRSMSTPHMLLSKYQRILCDDFAVDVDIVDTTDVDGSLKISTSLTHFHAVLCAFDLFMLNLIAKNKISEQKSGTTVANSEVSTVPAQQTNCSQIQVNMVLEDASCTFVREVGEYFTPLARAYSFCTMCRVSVTQPAPGFENDPPLTVDVNVHFSDDTSYELRDDEGMSLWAFNSFLGAWEPIVEPWTFELNVGVVNDTSGKLSIKGEMKGSEAHSLNFNFSPSLLETLCAIANELEPLSRGVVIPVSTATVISCGFYLANDCGVDISYWVSEQSQPASRSRGFSYAPRGQNTPETLIPRHKVPLKLSTAVFPALPSDQTVSFSLGDEKWHPLTDVRIQSTGKYIYSVLPKKRGATLSTSSPSESAAVAPVSTDANHAPILLALFDISAVFGYRTLTISSLVRVFNDTDVMVDCAVLGEDGKTITEIGTIDPQDACGVPITMLKSLTSVRLLIKPHKPDSAMLATAPLSPMTAGNPGAAVAPSQTAKDHRWSNELFITEKDDAREMMASCPLMIDDYDCKCQRMFDGSQPLHVSQSCKSNGCYFRVLNNVFTASNTSVLRYAQVRVLPPLVFENKCGVSLYVVVFVFKKVRRTNNQDRDAFHLVASEKIPPRSSLQFVASSLQDGTYCSISLTGFSWSKLFLLPGPDQPMERARAHSNAGSGAQMAPQSAPLPGFANGMLCTLQDFKARKATLNVSIHGALDDSCMRTVVIQPRFVIKNATHLNLTYEAFLKSKSRIPTAKAIFGFAAPSQKQSQVCCGSPQLEMIHTKLNALNGATTTSANPTANVNVCKTPRSTHSQQQLEEQESYYYSESATISLQIDGNTSVASGVQQFKLDQAVGGTNSTVRLYDETKKQWQDIGVILEQIDSYTTNVTFVERYVFVNRTDHELIAVPAGDIVPNATHDPASHVALAPQSTSQFHWTMSSALPQDCSVRLKVRSNETGWRWSGKFSLHDVSETALKLSNKFTSQVVVCRVEVRVESAVRMYVVLTSEDVCQFPLYRIVNTSTIEMIHFKQSFEGGSGNLSDHSPTSVDLNRGVTQRLFPGESVCFGWDEVYGLQSLSRVVQISLAADSVHVKLSLDQPSEPQKVELPPSKSKAASEVYVHWYLHGMTKTIQIHDTKLPRDHLTGKETAPAAESAALDKPTKPVLSEITVQLTIPNMLLSILNNTPEEMLLFSAENVFVYSSKTVGENDQLEVKIGSFQLDNQLEGATFPVIFTPTPNSDNRTMTMPDSPRRSSAAGQSFSSPPDDKKSTKDDEDPIFFHLSALRLNYGDDVEYIQYLSAMVQPARLQIDDFLVIAVANLATSCVAVVNRYFPPTTSRHHTVDKDDRTSSRSSIGRLSRSNTSEIVETAEELQTQSNKVPPVERRMYVETLQLHPVKIQLTFAQNNLTESSYFDSKTTILLPVVFMILKSNLVNIDGASLNLNALHIYHSFTTPSFMLSTVRQHYTFQGILQIYALVGAADILGNPIGLVTNLGVGVKDFFYEPVAGLVKSPQEFVFGLSRGTASLVKKSVFGTFNAASKFTGTLSSGIAALSMDSQYINARNARNRQDVPTHLGTGLYYGTKQLGQGILAGVSGVITAPAMGAYHNGLTGFVEGVGKGLIGVAVKPTAGILDLAARTTAGITATTTVFDKKARNTRMRLPRMMHTRDKRLRVYSNDEALISQLLNRLPQKLQQNEHYEGHVFLPSSRAIIATSHHLVHVDYSSIVGMAPSQPRITWKYAVASVWGAQKSPKGVDVLIGSAAGGHTIQSAATSRVLMSTVLVPLRSSDSAVIDRLVKLVSELVARERERAPVAETFSSPPPRNSIGLVLEPVRDPTGIEGYEGFGGLVADVFVGSASFRAGLQVGDVIVGFEKKKFELGDHGSALRVQLSMMKKGDSLELMVLRDGRIKTFTLATE
ncbi:TPA: hypothetical protein N0F65_000140 [Lagenidium giganteum]|uniref:PDZ domain-containing protein n=1 Tax=Lagenidium giganteum TaxID=4803 RepID=A0AAV2YXV5_9STRA|nr:TPA: hypothetical protein N0F65_000140 [Lagenidium giganteum]